ncbi:zinc finger protein 106 isoform X2 [Myripristis murdjan]|uniref:zinc finger protein 106 isoform X2 n=1 Tax=Myripristis murdjan TaxID=586833 RepID=UPI00117622DE|nr:zinc finger protein 106 isoform X2 [Myripristis murdjan]
MGKGRKCILCEMICSSKQEMDEHMRSMLHHRELENLKGRDCGHECKVCQVTVASLTEYAGHISSPSHKQNVDAADQKTAGNDEDEDYFDQALVELIEKRKELIRKEEEAAAAKRAKEEAEQRKQQEFLQRLKETKERFQKDCTWRPPPRGFSGSYRQGTWYGNKLSGGRKGEAVADSRPWQHSNQGKSATWHAQEPPNFQNWASGHWAGGGLRSQENWGNRQWDQGNKRDRLPWLSNGGSSYGVYGQNNYPPNPQQGKPPSLMGPIPRHPPPPSFFARALYQFHSKGSDQGGRQGDGHHNGEQLNADSDRNSSKTFGSNPKLDKACRWSPYPTTKLFDSVPQKDIHPSPSEKYPKVPTPQKQEKSPDTSISSSRSSNALRGGHQTSSPGPSKQKTEKPSEHTDRKLSLTSGVKAGAPLKKASNKEHEQPKPASQHSALSSKASPIEPLQSRQEQQLSEMLKKAKEKMLGKRDSMDISNDKRMETALHIVEEQQSNHPEGQLGMNKENNCRQNEAKPASPDSMKPYPCGDKKVNLTLPPPDSSQFLQSVQVSTSTMESSEPAASGKEDEEEDRKREEKVMGSETPDDTMQATESGQGSESDTSRSGQAQAAAGSTTASLSKLGLPPVLKRDLTKHISSKSKTVSHEPNLNSARRVRNVSESRKGETEKESGLKPTVRQLISSSGSRRNVNWEQVYQEVRKKQEQGKGMPRFGIEMVSYDQEEQSQEEDNIRLLEGFQWEMLMDLPASAAPRKRCLSESSLAPDCSGSSHSLFPPQISMETLHSPKPISAQRSRNNQRLQEGEQMLGQCEAKAQKQLDSIPTGTMKALQRSDSALGDSSSGTELNDSQGTGKKRRAAGDIPSPEMPCLERKNKRRKIKSKRERLQVEQLLAVSLREEELSRSLQTVDSSLIQARAALEAAYLEVQRLMVVKQQVTTEMNTLRNKRIELLKGMQGGCENIPQVKVKEEKMDSFDFEAHMASALSSVTDTALPSPCSAAQCASPPSSTLPFMPVVIKQEPLSPARVSTEPDPAENTFPWAHSTTPELPVPPAASHSDFADYSCQLSPERRSELYLTNREATQESFGVPAESKDSLSGVVQIIEGTSQSTRDSLPPLSDSNTHIALSSGSRRSSETWSVAEPTVGQSVKSCTVSLVRLCLPEARAGKRVRRRKKRGVLRKAQGVEQPESSDSEEEGEATRPRWIRARRRPSGGSHVSTSTPPATVEDEKCDRFMEGDKEEVEEASGPLSPADKPEEAPLEMVELHLVAPDDPVHVSTAEPEESMEVTTACQQPQLDSQGLAPSPGQSPSQSQSQSPDQVSASDSLKPEPQTLACNEVTSTSDMDVSPVVTANEGDVQMPLASPNLSETPSDASDSGEDEMLAEGAFEGHEEAVNAMQIYKGLLYTCSGDRTVKAFDLVSRKCVAVLDDHTSKVNCLLVLTLVGLHHRLYTGSSDKTIRCYSLKTLEFKQQFSLSDRVLCLHSRWKVLYAGLANGTVVTFDLKKNKQLDVFECQGRRAVSCLATMHTAARKFLLVGSYDSTIRVRDASSGLLLHTLEGHTKTVLCMKVVNDLVFSGSSDQTVLAHNVHTGKLVQTYRGHSHAVTEVAILGKVIVTACLDKLVHVCKLQSDVQLQVYGGHTDMVTCMAVYRNMIYTGCYDGSVQAVKLNLMQNYRCWWHGCSLIFGVFEHLQQHLINDHAGKNLQTLKCHWKNCEEFFCSRSSKQGIVLHMQKHAEEETEPKCCGLEETLFSPQPASPHSPAAPPPLPPY